ncbi:ABC transporter ATP-binding protein [Aquipseudomonas guryensis]|jgi:putative ABC transport system ATP-binding protein|nr:ABC transporter ATP-binding protein [Pseudomonas guryensis]
MQADNGAPAIAGAEGKRMQIVNATQLPIVRLGQVEKRYGKGEGSVHALQAIDLVVERGEFAALVGQSGSGKSTLLNLIGGIDKPSGGRVHFLGQDLAELNDRELAQLRAQEIGFIFQFFNLLPVLSVFDNVYYPLMLNGYKKEQARRQVMQALERVGLEKHAMRPPTELSGGQQQRVAIARALVKKPALVIADEPTGNLDSETGRSVLELMQEINRENGTTFIISTHADSVRDVASRVIRIADGKLQHA